jgi:2-oxoisovalerate dehydrogenase E1 component beta subunit
MSATKTLTYLEAINAGLRDEMRRDSSVVLLGEDIGPYGGAFKVTKGLYEEFGEERVIDTVIAEAAIVGASMGMAIAGLRPVAEMQFADFVTNAFNQLVENAAKYHYRTGIPLPMVVRLPGGGGLRAGMFHSVSPEGWFFHVAGLKIVAPSTPHDAKGLIKAAIRDNNPVLYIESKFLYRHVKAEVSEDDYITEIGKAEVKLVGEDVSVITYGTGVHWALAAAAELENDGVSVEVLDLRTLRPLDADAVIATAKKTGKVLVVHEDNLTGGIGAEISALITEHAFTYLDAPIRRVAALDTPIPFAPPLEDFVLPSAAKVTAALRSLAAY